MHAHLARLHQALKDEERHQRDEHARLLALPLDQQLEAGVRWPELRVADIEPGWSSDSVLVVATAALHDGIRPGDRVELRVAGQDVRGWVDDIVIRGAWVRLDRGSDTPEIGAVAALTRLFDATTYVRYRQALERAAEASGPLVEALLEGGGGGEVHDGDWPGLNDAQGTAAETALRAGPIALVHGPPGTGKTTLITHLLARLVADGDRPWALAESNGAVDHLALCAAARGLRVLRLGRTRRIAPAARHLSVDAAVAAGPFAAALAALDKELSRARGARTPGVLGPLIEERRRLERQARDHAIDGAEVLAVTLGTLAKLAPTLPPAHTAVVDEATQALEPAVWSAVPFVKRLVLVGDPNQLGPVVTQPNNPLGRTLLVRLLEDGTVPMPMLEVQHRMHADIQALVAHVYGPTYRPHATVAGWHLADLPDVESTPLTTASAVWIDTAGGGLDEVRDPVSRSLYNQGEIALVVKVLIELLEAGLGADDIGVIAPYSAQVARLREALPTVDVASVDGFQGREKAAIVCSFVRSNDRAEVGFLDDPRRLVVAATRAQRLWVGIGDSATLGAAAPFVPVLDALGSHGTWASVWDPQWSLDEG